MSVPTISSATLLCRDMVLVEFSTNMLNNPALALATNYTWAALDGGSSIETKQIFVPNESYDATPEEVIVVLLGRPEYGKRYRLTMANAVSITGDAIASTADIIGYNTRVDDVMAHMGKSIFNMEPTSLFRMTLVALLHGHTELASTNLTQYVGP